MSLNKISIKFPLIGFFLIALSTGTLAWIIYNDSKDNLETSLKKEVQGIATTASLLVASADSQNIKLILRNIQEINNLEKPVVISDPTDALAFVYQDGQGHWVKAYAPVKDEKDSIVSTISVDKKATEFVNKLGELKQALIELFAISVGVATFFFLGLTRPVIGRIGTLVKGTKSLSAGDLETSLTVKSNDELGQLTDSFNKMAHSLKDSDQKLRDWAENLEGKVQERTAEVAASRKEMETMLDNLDQGIFTFNLDKSVNPQHSSRAEHLFQETNFNHTDFKKLFQASDEDLKVFDQWVEMIQIPRFYKDWNHYLKLNPFREITRLHKGQRQILEIDYRPIINEGELQRIMVLGTDITNKRLADEALEATKKESRAEMERILSLVRNDKIALDSFFDDIQNYFLKFEKMRSSQDLIGNVKSNYRDLHTLKGNAGTFGFGYLSALASDLEDFFSEIQEGQEADLGRWFDGLRALQDEYKRIQDRRVSLFSESRDRMSVNQSAYDKLLSDLDSGVIADMKSFEKEIEALDSQSFGSFCEKFKKIVAVFREKSGKNILDLHVEGSEQMIHRSLIKAFDESLVHLVRNAVDHGIESNERRKALKKGPGKISLSFKKEKNQAQIKISDDGGGIDLEKVVEKAIHKRLIKAKNAAQLTQKEKMDLIFHSGLSTKETATETSGRGVGMAAVKNYIENLGGTISLESKLDEGTTIRLVLPDQMLSQNLS